MIEDAAQYRELVKLYGTYGDGELLALGRGMADLTEMAQTALREEMARRGLVLERSAEPEQTKGLSEDDLARVRAYAALAPPECVFEFEDEQGASAAYLALAEEGIEAVALAGGAADGDRRGPRVVVAPGDAQRAAAVLSRPMAERFKNEADGTPLEFDLPACPECGGGETMLEAVDPANHWRCDDCGHSWVDDAGSGVQ